MKNQQKPLGGWPLRFNSSYPLAAEKGKEILDKRDFLLESLAK
jgi:hypothetical protein